VAWFLGQSIVFVVLAFLLGVLVGWIVWGRLSWGSRPARSAPEVSSRTTPAEAPAAESVVVAPEPELVSTSASTVADGQGGLGSGPAASPGVSSLSDEEPDGAPGGGAVAVAVESTVESEPPAVPDDDLERVEGIGPKISAALHDAGIRTFRQLADSDDAALRAALKAHNLRFAPSLVTWARQARLLADGDDAGFADLTRRLVAGRDVGRP